MVNLLQLALPHAQRRTPSRTHGHMDTRTEISSPQRGRGVPFIDAKALDVVSHQKREDTRRPCRQHGERSQSAPGAGRTWAQGRVRCCLWPDPSPSRHTPHQTQAGSPTHQASSSRKGTRWGCGRVRAPGCRAGTARRTRMDQDGVDERAGRSQAHVCEEELQKITSEKTAAFTLTHLTFTLGLESCNPPRRT